MSLFGSLKKNQADWDEAYIGQPNFYGKPDGSVFGVFSLTEDTLTGIPEDPKSRCQIDGKEVAEWKVCFISTTRKSMIGDMDYYEFLSKAAGYIADKKDSRVLIRNLSLSEMEEILKK